MPLKLLKKEGNKQLILLQIRSKLTSGKILQWTEDMIIPQDNLRNGKGNAFAKLQVKLVLWNRFVGSLKGLSYEIDFENVDENGQILA
jgi:hypothetical protein